LKAGAEEEKKCGRRLSNDG